MVISFKKIPIIIAMIIVVAIICVQFLPKPKLSFTEEQELIRVVEQTNSNLPRPIGTIGQFDSIAFEKSKLIYHFTTYGDGSIDDFYKTNYHAIGELMKYGIITLNGQKGSGTKFAQLIRDKGISLMVEITTPNKTNFHWNYTGQELCDFINKMKLTPTEALYSIIETQIALTNLNLPIKSNDIENVHSITTNAIATTCSDEERLIRIHHEGSNVIFVHETSERNITVAELRKESSNLQIIEFFAALLSEDADMKEFINMLVLSHSDITYRMLNANHTDSVNITIPYNILKNYCSIPLNSLL